MKSKIKNLIKKLIKKFAISLPKANLYLNEEKFAFGSSINGHIEIKGGLIKNMLNRYEIDLVREEKDSQTEELLNTRFVYCSKECLPNKKEILPFILNVPESEKKSFTNYHYCLRVRVVLADSQSVLKKHPLKITS
jgi:sporulation-control protein spo0M